MRALLLFAMLVGVAIAADQPAVQAPPAAAAAPAVTAATAAQRVAYIPIDGMIDALKAAYFKRALADARAAKVDAVVVHLTTNGGTVDAGTEMMKTAMGVPKDGPVMVAFIDNHSYSAGSLIAYGHRKIFLTPGATLGDIGVIYQGPDGEMKYAPEKFETVVRSLLRSAAQNNGWNEAKLVKMTARNQDLYRFDLKEGPAFVIEDDLPRFLADHPEENDGDKVLILGHDRLISYTAKEAVDERMATGMVDGLDGVYKALGAAPASVVDLSPTATERASWVLAGWAPLLAALAVGFLVLEFKTPGVGIWAVLAGICGVAFFVCQFYQDLANYLEVVLVLVGIACVIVELFLFHTGGALAVTGLGLCVVGLVLSFMPDAEQFHPDSPTWTRDLLTAISDSLLAFLALGAGVVMAVMYLPKLRLFRRLAVAAEIAGTSDAGADIRAGEAAPGLVGKRGTARTELRPSGFVVVEGSDLSATTEHGEFLQPGDAVEVVAVRFGEAIVRAPAAGRS
jgi:membrane-bound serine protease (ClpP class)